jgi:predicted transcriptional regulator
MPETLTLQNGTLPREDGDKDRPSRRSGLERRWMERTDRGFGPITYLCATLIYVEVIMATRNITLALPEEVLKQVKIIAAKRETSVSAMLREKLKELVQEEDEYSQAMREALEALEHGFELGTYGKATWTRDELHER